MLTATQKAQSERLTKALRTYAPSIGNVDQREWLLVLAGRLEIARADDAIGDTLTLHVRKEIAELLGVRLLLLDQWAYDVMAKR